MPMENQKTDLIKHLADWQIQLEGEWSLEEIQRVLRVFETLAEQTSLSSIPELFNRQITTLKHSGRPGRVGRTKDNKIILDDDWTDWTFAHELGHRWNNAWDRLPEQRLRQAMGAGKFEWLKEYLRRFEKWLEGVLKKFNIKKKIDWPSLWYKPGSAPPPCGVDRNFNASEDLAESFAATIFPGEAKTRASNVATRAINLAKSWDWSNTFSDYLQTPRGQITLQTIKELGSHREYRI